MFTAVWQNWHQVKAVGKLRREAADFLEFLSVVRALLARLARLLNNMQILQKYFVNCLTYFVVVKHERHDRI